MTQHQQTKSESFDHGTATIPTCARSCSYLDVFIVTVPMFLGRSGMGCSFHESPNFVDPKRIPSLDSTFRHVFLGSQREERPKDWQEGKRKQVLQNVSKRQRRFETLPGCCSSGSGSRGKRETRTIPRQIDRQNKRQIGRKNKSIAARTSTGKSPKAYESDRSSA